MKKLFQKYGGFLATLAIVVTTMNANATCLCIFGDYNFQSNQHHYYKGIR
ncbi:MAG: cyclic lactone autoinducer peptide [Ruminococcus sp.]|nr:cyclic lactone autoinducer peptide [Ruminococcus sp.]